MSQRQKYLLSVFFVFVLVAVSVYLIYPPAKSTRLGLDLKGGLHIVLTAKPSPGAPVTEETMERAKIVIQERINKLGVSEPEISRQGSNSILVQLPGIKDPQAALDIIGKTALLEFRPVTTETAEGLVLGEPLLTGQYVKDAAVDFDELGKPKVDMEFTPEGAKKFDQITAAMVGQRLAIVLDYNPRGKSDKGKGIISAPVIRERISGGRAEITGNFDLDFAKKLALVLQTGSLPVKLDISESRTVGPTLGSDSLRAALIAGIAGLIAVMVYMIFFYRLLGVLTAGALTVFSLLFWGVIVSTNKFTPLGWTLTLPGIAGIILAIGVAADSSVVIFERVKEEIRLGKSFKQAADKGFTFGFKTMIDADVVTLIAALILIWQGVGAVRGFAISLSVGILIDLFTTFFFTRPLLALLSSSEALNRSLLLGVRKEVG